MSAEKKLIKMSENAQNMSNASYLEGSFLALFLVGLLFLSNMRNPLGEFVQCFVAPIGRLFGVNYNLILIVAIILVAIMFKNKGDDFAKKAESLKDF